MHKPSRKNARKERIFSLPQNKIDFKYQSEHQATPHEFYEKEITTMATKIPKLLGKRIKVKTLLTAKEVRESLKKIAGWQFSKKNKMIYRDFIIQDFMAAIKLINHIAKIAEEEKHHPNIHLTDYSKLRVELTTHDVGGLSDHDFIGAGRINDLSMELKHS